MEKYMKTIGYKTKQMAFLNKTSKNNWRRWRIYTPGKDHEKEHSVEGNIGVCQYKMGAII